MPRRPTPTSVVAVAALALAGLAACHPKSLAQGEHDVVQGQMHGGVHVQTSEALSSPVSVVDRLECPQSEGALKRTSQSADGRACSYASEKGVVDLSLAPGGAADPHAALAPVKARLDAMMPREANGGTVAVSTETDANGRDHSNVDLPFIHVRDDGKRSHVRIFGMTVDSDDDDNKTANTTAAKRNDGTESVYVLAGESASPEGYHAVGYVARGATRGPLLIGVFKYRQGGDTGMHTGEHEHDNDFDRLIDLNAPKG